MANMQTKILSINDSNINESYKNIQRLREIGSLDEVSAHLEKERASSGTSKRHL